MHLACIGCLGSHVHCLTYDSFCVLALANEAMDNRNTWTTYNGNRKLEHKNFDINRSEVSENSKATKQNDIIDLSGDFDQVGQISQISNGAMNIESSATARLQSDV